MIKKIISIFLVFLVVMIPITSANFLNPYEQPASNFDYGSNLGGFSFQDPFGDELRKYTTGYGEPIYLGSSIIVNVADYEPKQVRQAYLEQSNVPVYMYLKGTTLGTAGSLFGGDPSQRDPTSGITSIPRIRSIEVFMNETSEGYQHILGAPRYIPPRVDTVSLGNMGALIVYLKRLENEDQMPEGNTISLQMNAKINFDLEDSKMFGLGKQSLTLNKPLNEEEFSRNKELYSIFSGKGFIRLVNVDSSGATLQVYSRDMHPLFINTMASRSSTEAAGLQGRSVFRLRESGSQLMSFGYTGNVLQDTFQIILDKIVTPGDNAEFEFSVQGRKIKRKVKVGESLTPKSNWILDSINEGSPVDIIQKIKELINDLISDEENLKQIENIATIRNIFTNQVIKLTSYGVTNEDSKNPCCKIEELENEDAIKLEKEFCPYTTNDPIYRLLDVKEEINKLACEALVGYKQVIDKYPKSEEAVRSASDLAFMFDERTFGCPSGEKCFAKSKKLAKYYHKKAGESTNDEIIVEGEDEYLEDLGIFVKLIKVDKFDDSDRGSFTLRNYEESGSFADIPEKKIENKLFGEETLVTYPGEDGETYAWFVTSINPGSVGIGLKKIVKKDSLSDGQLKKDQLAEPILNRIELKTNKPTQVPMQYVKGESTGEINPQEGNIKTLEVKNIDTDLEAYVTVLPGSTSGYTESSFTLNIPIDPRPFKWTPEMLNDHINATQNIIEKLDDMIKTLDDVVSTWKKVCLGTFAFLVLKSSLLQSPVRAQARKISSNAFKERCEGEVIQQATKEHPDFDNTNECMNHYSSDISKATDATENAFKDANEKLEGNLDDVINKKVSNTECGSFKEFAEGASALGKTNTEILQNYRDCYAYANILSTVDKSDPYHKYIEDKINDIDTKGAVKIKEEVEKLLNGKDIGNDPEKKRQIYAQVVDAIRDKEKSEKENLKGLTIITDLKTIGDNGIISEAFGTIVTTKEDKNNVVPTNLIGVNKYIYLKSKCTPPPTTSDAECNNLDKNKESLKNQFASEGGKFVYVDANNFDTTKNEITGSPTFYTSNVKTDEFGRTTSGEYYQNKLESIHDKDGLAVCYPTGKDGEYVKVLERGNAGSKPAESIELWNVGSNKKIDCGRPDDVILKQASELGLADNRDLRNRLLSLVRSAGQCKNNNNVIGNANGKPVRCKSFDQNLLTSAIKPECTDVMEPEDCKILFNACDPVMCPSSRCNLGGRVAPRNVIQSGIIGSVALCLPNVQQGIAVPVCLTGIDAGLKNIRSLAQSYKDCLEIKLKNNEDVGFCDYIRSVGICEVLWREGSEILDISGGVTDWATGKLFGDPKGGGEYLNFQSSFQNAADTVQFFTNEYKETYAAQFLSKSTDEIGSEICRLSVNGRIPYPGEILDYLTEPEDPPQFTAFFDEAPYSSPGELTQTVPGIPFGTTELSLYKVFYHIYAGTGYYEGIYSQPSSLLGPKPNAIQQPILYSVYLIDKTRTLQPLYVTFKDDENLFGYQGSVEPGKYVQKTVEKLGASGYDQICVNINGRETCGFGKTSSSFGIEELQNVLENKEAKKKEIETAEECVSTIGNTESASLNRLAALGGAALYSGIGITAGADLSGIGGSATANLLSGSDPAVGLVTSGLDRSALSNGITRVCAFALPTPDPDRWIDVGTCGKDKNGIELGKCYLDSESISITDAKQESELLKKLKLKDYLNAIDEKTSKDVLSALNNKRDEIVEDTIKFSETEEMKKLIADILARIATSPPVEIEFENVNGIKDKLDEYKLLKIGGINYDNLFLSSLDPTLPSKALYHKALGFNKLAGVKLIFEKEIKKKKITEETEVTPEIPAKESDVRWPIDGNIIITSCFGKRDSPTEGASSDHNGIDLQAKEGTKVYAIMEGTVSEICSNTDSCGNTGKRVVIKHNINRQTKYFHLSKVSVRKDEKVLKSTKIGESGNTGLSTAAHLHFEFISNNIAINPLTTIFKNMTPTQKTGSNCST